MPEEEFDLSGYMASEIDDLVNKVFRTTFTDPQENAFMMRYMLASRKASRKRAELEARGDHIPPFLIASVTGRCNLHCTNCNSRNARAYESDATDDQLSMNEWGSIFKQSKRLGISFIFLVGGEPMIRRDVLQKAAEFPDILFPVFTNGTLLDDEYVRLFDEARNLIPIFSINGDKKEINQRRGKGAYQKMVESMGALKKRRLIFGASVTVTRDNLHQVVGQEFLSQLQQMGCAIVLYAEFVPATDDSSELALQDAQREFLRSEIAKLRDQYADMLLIAVPGDTKTTGGCLAGGRGFFHIDPYGGAEPCLFSPVSDINVRDASLSQALHSELFTTLQTGDVLMEDHDGGCALFEGKEPLEDLLA